MRKRSGFTIIELLVVLIVGGILMAAAYRTIISQERSYRVYDAAVSTQQATRLSLQVLSAELREMSTEGADLAYANDDSITFRALRKLGFICELNKPLKQITVVRLGSEAFVGGANGDSVVVYVDGDTLTGSDDSWDLAQVSNASAATCTSVAGLAIASALVGGTQTLLKLNGAPHIDSVNIGAPVRSFDRVTYAVKQFGDTWYLARATAPDTMVPIIGPLAPPSRGGLVFTYYDTIGNTLTSLPLDSAARAAVHRIQVTVRGQKTTNAGTMQTYLDSLTTDIFIRGG
ncbi:MAG: prepilin-type N-terminal cleavage/methylation domain-containing protein [Gemmatimonadota bacterium]|jgi:prepilin-type N-terminal cleavage/methylation domain-containing protein